MARGFGVVWDSVQRAVDAEAARRFADQHIYSTQRRLCRAIGGDEKVMNRAGRRRRRRYLTVIVIWSVGCRSTSSKAAHAGCYAHGWPHRLLSAEGRTEITGRWSGAGMGYALFDRPPATVVQSARQRAERDA